MDHEIKFYHSKIEESVRQSRQYVQRNFIAERAKLPREHDGIVETRVKL